MEEDRFETAWSEHCHALTRYCTFSTGSSQDGEDIAAEVFSRLLATKKDIGPDKVEAWLFTVAHNLCMSHHRANTRNRKLMVRLGEQQPATNGDAWSDSVLWEAARGLDERARLIIYLRVIEDRPFSDVARLTRASEGATKMVYYRSMERLKTLLVHNQSECAEPRAGGVVDVD